MTRVRLRHLPADILGLSELAKAALADRPHPATLPGIVLPDSLDAVPRYAGSLDDDDREELATLFERGIAPHEPHVQVIESIRALRSGDACMVVAGQQPGFLGGPLYDAYKAIHTIRLARDLSAAWGVPVVPAFWNHADDHDIAEVRSLWIQNKNQDLRKVGLAGESSGRRPLDTIVFEEERHRLVATAEVLRDELSPGQRFEARLDAFLPRAGETFAGAFTRAMLELFGRYGLVVFEPRWIRTPLSRSLAHVVASNTLASLQASSDALRAAGGEPPIDPTTAALLFHHEDGARRALRADGPDYRYDGEPGSRTPSELAAEIVQAPEEWSAGALLRPLVQDRTLPVVAYVGGWGELAYHAQMPKLREASGVPRTAFVPRLSATIVEPPVAASLEKLGLDVRAVLEAKGRIAGDDEPAESEAARRLRAVVAETKERLFAEREHLADVDKGLAGQLKKVASQVESLVEKLAAKADRVVANSKGSAKLHERRVANALYPRDEPQERVRGSVEIIGRWGRAWIDELLDGIEALPTEHVVLTLDAEPGDEE